MRFFIQGCRAACIIAAATFMLLATERNAAAQIPVTDGLMMLQLGYPVGGYLSTIVGLGLDMAPSSRPSADDLTKQLPGTNDMVSDAGKTISNDQDEALNIDPKKFQELRDRNDAFNLLLDREKQIINEVRGNAVDSIKKQEDAEWVYMGVSLGIKAAPDLATAVAVTNTLLLAQLKRTGDLERVINNNTIAATIVENSRIEARLIRRADLEATRKMLD